MVNILENELQLTKAGFLRIIETYKRQGLTIKDSYYAVEKLCTSKGYSMKFSSYESFKDAYYSKKPNKK